LKKKSFFSFFREKSLFFTCLELFLPDEKAPNETDQKQTKKVNDFFGRNYFWYKVIFPPLFALISEKVTFLGKVTFFGKVSFVVQGKALQLYTWLGST
jgi:hypothetical protein